jgi:hypothetical protein
MRKVGWKRTVWEISRDRSSLKIPKDMLDGIRKF